MDPFLNPVTGVAIAALVVSVITLVASHVGLKGKSGNDRVDRLERRVESLEVKLRQCEAERDDKQREIIALHERIVEITAGG